MYVSSACASDRIACSPSSPFVAFQRQLGRTLHDRRVIAREIVLAQQFADFHLHQLEQLRVINHVRLVQEHDDVRHANLARQQNVLARLRHRAVCGRHHQDRAVHLRSTRDHVLHVVSVTWAINVRVVTRLRLVLNVRGVDRDPTRLLFRRRVNLVVAASLAAELVRQHRRDRRRQRRFAVVNVTNRTHVHVRLGTFKLAFAMISIL